MIRSRNLACVLVGVLLISLFACSNQPPPPKVVPIESRPATPVKK